MSALSYKFWPIAIGCILLTAPACKRKITPAQVQDQLRHAMLAYLQKQPNYDSTKVKFEVVNVAYFEDTTYYICNFNVRMKVPSRNIDTVGIMSGIVSKDFSIVHRRN